MFRLAFISIITLRVILCPLLCIACDDSAQALRSAEAHVCTCADRDREPCQDGESLFPFDTPTDCPCPCDMGCVCQVTPELNIRSAAIDFFLTVDFLPVCFDTLNLSRAFASYGEERPHRLDLESGRDVRIAHASFLL